MPAGFFVLKIHAAQSYLTPLPSEWAHIEMRSRSVQLRFQGYCTQAQTQKVTKNGPDDRAVYLCDRDDLRPR
jgi:hypothetical protein